MKIGKQLSAALLFVLVIAIGFGAAYLYTETGTSPGPVARAPVVEPGMSKEAKDVLILTTMLAGQAGALNEWYGRKLQEILTRYIPEDKSVEFGLEVEGLNLVLEMLINDLHEMAVMAVEIEGEYSPEQMDLMYQQALRNFEESVNLSTTVLEDLTQVFEGGKQDGPGIPGI